MKSIDDVRSFLNSIRNINRGGCGVAALAMYRWLVKNKMIHGDESFVFLYDYTSKWLYERNQKYVEGVSNELASCNHVALTHNNEIFDTEELVNVTNYRNIHILKSEKDMVISLQNYRFWNDEFDRNKGIKKIMKKLDIDLSDVIIPNFCFS